MASLLLEGKHILVTGASRGLGRHLAESLSAAGAHLLLTARSPEGLADTARALPGTVHTLPLDLALPGAPAALIAHARTLFSTLDGLVNNAAAVGPIGPLWETPAADWEDSLRLNLLAPLDLCRHAIPWMLEAGAGSIVNLSGGGATASRPRFSAYAAAKTALVRLTEILADELAGTGLRVNAIAPGAMNTEMLEAVLRAGPALAGPEYEKAIAQRDRGGASPDRAAALCAFLLSDASRALSGRLLSALWDPWADLPSHAATLAASDIYTLRRILPADRGHADWEPAQS